MEFSVHAQILDNGLHLSAESDALFFLQHLICRRNQMFGQEGAKIPNYIEWFPKDFVKGTNMAMECAVARVE
ncbi:hypothetical protein C5167_030765 [Papaver somniferum]|nr:hypothetical protein C5167_030765 [Papaver somniferum]